MIKIDKFGITEPERKEEEKVMKDVYETITDTYHYLSLDGQIGGFSPFNVVVTDEIRNNEESIIRTMEERGEIGSFFPKRKITFYPFKRNEGVYGYKLDLKNIDKHFCDILKLNDLYYKTDKMIVDVGHLAENFDSHLFIEKLKWLLKNSKYLKSVYIEYIHINEI